MCYIDLDQFKIVNDTCGHHAGDELLRQLTALYKKHVRHTEHFPGPDGDHLEPALARLGGDEFGLLLYNCPPAGTRTVAERLIESTKAFRFAFGDQQFSVGCSIGLVSIQPDNEGAAQVMKQADSACYVAKEKGRGRAHLYEPDDEDIEARHLAAQWAPRITEAVETNRFKIYCQKIAPLLTEEEGDRFEILLRYQTDTGEMLPPGAFLPAAERFSLMPLIDKWVIEQTFNELEILYGAGSEKTLTSASINLSGQTLGEPWLLEHICRQFDPGSMRPDQICFEITETAAITNLNTATRVMGELADIGCRFSLDDFGSGLSSFSYLKNLRLDYLKIDGSLVRDIANDPIGQAMVTSINQVGHVMGIKTVAEWVEDDTVLAILKEIGIDYGQGYGIGKPLPLLSIGAEIPSKIRSI